MFFFDGQNADGKIRKMLAPMIPTIRGSPCAWEFLARYGGRDG
jgi:hypothetical protein